MDLYQSEFNCFKEEPFDFDINDEPFIDNETQVKYEETGGKRPHDYIETFQCTICDFSCTSADNILNHNNCRGNIKSSIYLDCKKMLQINYTPIFVKRGDYDPSKDSRTGNSSNIDGDNECDSDLSLSEDSDIDEDDDDNDGMDEVEFRESDIKMLKPRFVCSVCGIAKAKWEDIMQHSQKHAYTTSKYRCKECNFKTDKDEEFEIHKIVHKMEVDLNYKKCIKETSMQVPIKCSKCDYMISSEYDMLRHMMKHSGENPLKCNDNSCDFIAISSSILKNHMKLIHSSEKPFKCNHIGCTYATKLPHVLKKHIDTHTGNKLFACPECEYKNTEKRHFKVHMKECHSDLTNANVINQQGKSSYYCTQCSMEFDSHDGLVMYLMIHNRYWVNNNFQCPECKRNFNLKDILENHTLSLNNLCSPNKLKCNGYNYKDNSMKNTEIHTTSFESTNLEVEQFECSLCDYISSSEKDIQEHSSICNGIAESYERNIPFDQECFVINNNTNNDT